MIKLNGKELSVYHIQLDLNLVRKSINENWFKEYIVYLHFMKMSNNGVIKFKSINALSKTIKKSNGFTNKWLKKLKDKRLITISNKTINLFSYNDVCRKNNSKKKKWLKLFFNNELFLDLDYIRDYIRCELLKYSIRKQLYKGRTSEIRYSYAYLGKLFNISKSQTYQIVKKFKQNKWIYFKVKNIIIEPITYDQYLIFKQTEYFEEYRNKGIFYSKEDQSLVKKVTHYYL